MSEKMELWNRVYKTPSEHLKGFNNGRFSGKSIDPVYRIKLLTETFGPPGEAGEDGWFFHVSNRWREDFDGQTVVYVTGSLSYFWDGQWRATPEHTGGTVVGKGADEAYKMAETDALGKCCVDIGMCADVYMGEHDGDKHQARREPTSTQSPEPTPRVSSGDWRSAVVPVGKHKGKTLGDLQSDSLSWFQENFEANPRYPDSAALREALDNSMKG